MTCEPCWLRFSVRNCDSVWVNRGEPMLEDSMSFCTCPGPLTVVSLGSSSSRIAP